MTSASAQPNRRQPKLKIQMGADDRMWWLRSGKSKTRKRCVNCTTLENMAAYFQQCEVCDGLVCQKCMPRYVYTAPLRSIRPLRGCRACKATD